MPADLASGAFASWFTEGIFGARPGPVAGGRELSGAFH